LYDVSGIVPKSNIDDLPVEEQLDYVKEMYKKGRVTAEDINDEIALIKGNKAELYADLKKYYIQLNGDMKKFILSRLHFFGSFFLESFSI
jgi:hypothetical protein